jgi:hypothetical protein
MSAVTKVKGYMATMSAAPKPASETKFIKVGDIYVSEATCKADPKQCEVAPPIANITQVKNKTTTKRTAAECSAARQKDWEVYCWQNALIISCVSVNAENKNMVLDNLAEGYYSNQAVCLRGE